jgi:hypothetical protein
MEKFIFTFNAGHPFVDHCQEVFAENEVQAKTRMTERYGREWKLGYTEAEFIELERKVRSLGLPLKKRLVPIYCRGMDKQ